MKGLLMVVHNSEVAKTFNKLADLLEIEGANVFRVRAYREAARTVEGLPRNLAEMIDAGDDLTALAGIGKDLAGKIEEIVRRGKLTQLEELQQRLPGQLSELLDLPGLGPKRVKALYQELGIEDRAGLERAAREGKVRQLEGLGAKTEQKILEELEKRPEGEQRNRLVDVEEFARSLVDYLRQVPGVKQVTAAGSYRRRKETVRDLDILVTCRRGSPVMDRFVAHEDVAEVVSKGTTRSTVRLRTGLQVDVRVVADASYGAALHYFTGSKAHNIAVRKIGVGRKLKINEYGVFQGDKRIAGRTEKEVFDQVGLSYIEPELREDRGEIEAAKNNRLPKLITLENIRGDLHCHTKASDGKHSLEEMAEAARQRGYDYLAITEHSKRLTVARGLDEKRLAAQIREIDKLNEKLGGVRILKGIEVDVLEDGSLDLAENILKELDVVVCAIHSKFNLPADKQTDRAIRAMDNPCCNILAHPTGRMIGQRDPYEVDVERLMQAALQRGCFVELNAQPDRLDLTDIHCRLAKQMGLKLAISTDSHATASLDFMRYGIDQARRGWLEPDDVINTKSWRELKKLLKRP